MPARGFVLVLRAWDSAPEVLASLFPFCPLVPSPTHSALHPQACVRLLSSGRPMLYSFQTSLPKLPVPSVQATIQRVRACVRHHGGQGRLDLGLVPFKEWIWGWVRTGLDRSSHCCLAPTLTVTWLDSTWSLCGPCWMTRSISAWRY